MKKRVFSCFFDQNQVQKIQTNLHFLDPDFYLDIRHPQKKYLFFLTSFIFRQNPSKIGHFWIFEKTGVYFSPKIQFLVRKCDFRHFRNFSKNRQKISKKNQGTHFFKIIIFEKMAKKSTCPKNN